MRCYGDYRCLAQQTSITEMAWKNNLRDDTVILHDRAPQQRQHAFCATVPFRAMHRSLVIEVLWVAARKCDQNPEKFGESR
jgi:hypothetical protein